MKEIDRRTLLKGGFIVATGFAVGELMVHAGRKINEETARVTGHPTGNASVRQEIEETCRDTNDPQECARNYEPSTNDIFSSIVIAPPSEEFLFRGLPSGILSAVEGKEDPGDDVFFGTGGIGMTRRELLVGLLTSTLFGASHNLTTEGVDTKTIPASQTVSGMVYWYLQRRLGLPANTLAHAWANFRRSIRPPTR